MPTSASPPAAPYRATVIRTNGFFNKIRQHVAEEVQQVLNYLLPSHARTLNMGQFVEILRTRLAGHLPDPAAPVYHFEFQPQAEYLSFTISSTEYGLIELRAKRNEPRSLLKLSLHTVASAIRSVEGLAQLQRQVPGPLMKQITTTYYGLLEYRPYRSRVGSGLSLRLPRPPLNTIKMSESRITAGNHKWP